MKTGRRRKIVKRFSVFFFVVAISSGRNSCRHICFNPARRSLGNLSLHLKSSRETMNFDRFEGLLRFEEPIPKEREQERPVDSQMKRKKPKKKEDGSFELRSPSTEDVFQRGNITGIVRHSLSPDKSSLEVPTLIFSTAQKEVTLLPALDLGKIIHSTLRAFSWITMAPFLLVSSSSLYLGLLYLRIELPPPVA